MGDRKISRHYCAGAERLFAGGPELFDLILLLRRGDELEFFFLWRPVWATDTVLVGLVGEPILPGRLLKRAYMYDRYTVLKN